MKKELELYIHIPFCVKKCLYCDFLSGPQSKQVIDAYVMALIREIKVHSEHSRVITSIFLGGGTPSILEATHIQQIFAALREAFQISTDAEITIEANPGTITQEKLKAYNQVGINRISFGLQSTNNEELKILGRIHTFEEFLYGYRLARECGFNNINVDLISAIPKQTLESWEETLNKVIALSPEHISAYSLIIEEGTPFAKDYGEGCCGARELPSEDEERLMYQKTEELLKEAGYYRYEISNYAKAGKECKHNLGYWERKDYLGLGLGASSLMDNIRYTNTENLIEYIEHSATLKIITCNKERLTTKEQMEEFVFLGMRKMEGISRREFKENFGVSIEERYGQGIRRMLADGLIEESGEYLHLTSKGIDVSNYVFAEILYE